MSYQRFDLSKISLPVATVATPATLPVTTAPTVAIVATVARPTTQSSVPVDLTVADVATVAGPEIQTGILPVPSPRPAIRIVAPAREMPACEYDAALDQLIAAAADPERTRLLWAKRKGACVAVKGETIFTRGRI